MCRPVEWNDGASSSASRQGYILNCMQERDFCAFSTVRCIDFVEPFGVGCKKFEVIIKKVRSGFYCELSEAISPKVMSYGESNSYCVIPLLIFFTFVRPLR